MDNLDHQRTRKLHHRRLPTHPPPHLRAYPPRQLLHPDPNTRFAEGGVTDARIRQWENQEVKSGDVELDEDDGERMGICGAED